MLCCVTQITDAFVCKIVAPIFDIRVKYQRRITQSPPPCLVNWAPPQSPQFTTKKDRKITSKTERDFTFISPVVFSHAYHIHMCRCQNGHTDAIPTRVLSSNTLNRWMLKSQAESSENYWSTKSRSRKAATCVTLPLRFISCPYLCWTRGPLSSTKNGEKRSVYHAAMKKSTFGKKNKKKLGISKVLIVDSWRGTSGRFAEAIEYQFNWNQKALTVSVSSWTNRGKIASALDGNNNKTKRGKKKCSNKNRVTETDRI